MASPIEIMLRNGIVMAAESRGFYIFDYSATPTSVERWPDNGGRHVVEPDECEEWGADGVENVWCLFGQVQVDSYRIDLMMAQGGALLAIECDGFEFHDRTKQQAAYDRARDRHLLISGIPVIRFTGSEIHHSLERCVADVYAAAKFVLEQWEAPLHMWGAGERAERERWQQAMAARPRQIEEHW